MISGMAKSLTFLTLRKGKLHAFVGQDCYSQRKAALVTEVLPQSSEQPRFYAMCFLKHLAEFSVL